LDGRLGEGYGVPTTGMFEAVRLVARSEGLLVDPVYGGRALAGLIATIRAGAISGESPVPFIMTGGLPGHFAYEPTFLSKIVICPLGFMHRAAPPR